MRKVNSAKLAFNNAVSRRDDLINKEEEYNEKHNRRHLRKARLFILKKELAQDQLISLYKSVTKNLIQISLSRLNELRLSDFRDYFRLVRTHTELTKLLFNLTSPVELLTINRQFINAVLDEKIEFDEGELGHRQLKEPKVSRQDSRESLKTTATTSFNQDSITNEKYLSRHIDDFKNIFIKNDYFMDLSTSFVKTQEFYSLLIEQQQQQQSSNSNSKLTGEIKEAHVNSFKSVILNGLVLGLGLLRNICLEKSDVKFTTIVCRLFDFKMEPILIGLCNLKKLNKEFFEKKYDNLSFVILSTVFQIFSLLFSKLHLINAKYNKSKSGKINENQKNV